MAKHSASILELARRGAQARYEELQAELSSLARQFPGLTSGARQVVRRGTRAVQAAAKELKKPTRKRKRMSVAARKALSARMKKYWAARRRAKE